MSITRMKAVTITGEVSEFDRVAEKYVYGRDIHLENAMSVITNRGRLTAFEDNEEYDTAAKSALSIMNLAKYTVNPKLIAPEMTTLREMQSFIEDINTQIEAEKKQDEELSNKIKANSDTIEQLEHMSEINADLSRLMSFEFIRCRFGHIPKTSYKTLMTYLDSLDAFFVKTSEDEAEVWGFYFVPLKKEAEMSELFNSLYFEAVGMPDGFEGTPKQIKQNLVEQNRELELKIAQNSEKTADMLKNVADKLCGMYNLAKKRYQLDEIRRNAVHGDMFFYIVGWMDAREAKRLEKEITSSGDTVMCYIESPETVKNIQPPTKLKNNPVFKPFEMFVKMYGLPSYNEIDPTGILAVTYILFFGIMFGDVGQAAILSIAGFLLYKFKKMDLAGIVGWVGLSGILFGFIYGSFFGNEEIIPNLLNVSPLRPMEQILLMLGGAIGVGVLTIVFGIALNIYNSFRDRRYGDAIFGHNGIAGIVFYVSLLLTAGNVFLKWGVPGAVFAALIAASLIAMYLSEPLTKLIEGKKGWLPKSGMFYVESFFELFEVLLSFVTNTLSFIRIGAFAIIHVGMMTAVAVLAKGGGAGGVVVQILGNALVMVLEGLIVGIQVLRLEYYEMFSRYFSGKGREFISLKDK